MADEERGLPSYVSYYVSYVWLPSIVTHMRSAMASNGPNLTILRKYAQKSNPATLPPSILFKYTTHTITIFDAYPKAIFHFLVLPRIRPPLNVFHLSNLRTLLKRDRAHAREVVCALAEDARDVRRSIEEEMVSRYGFKWEIWTGFHAVPSMEWAS